MTRRGQDPSATASVALAAGVNHLRLQASVNSAGAIALAGKISAAGLGEARFEDAVTLRRPRVLLVSHDPAASEEHLVRTLEANQFEVDRAPDGIPDKLDDYQLVVINNWDMESIPAAAQGGAGGVRQEGRRPALDRRRAQRLRGQEGPDGRPAGAHAARQAGAAALARRHRRGADHRQVVLHGRPQDRAGAPGGHRRGGEPAAHRFGGRADLRQFVPVGRAHAQGRRPRQPSSS